LSESLPSKRVASIFLLRDDSALLLQHRDDKPGLPLAGRWAPPGGHCDANENLETCARREMLEETGYECSELNLLDTIVDDNIENEPPYLLTAFWTLYDGRQRLRCGEGQAVEFVARTDVSHYDVPEYLVRIWDQAIVVLKNRRLLKECR